MSEKLTRIRLRHSRSHCTGLMDWGEHTFEEMVQQIRAKAQRELEAAQAILEADDVDFDVAIVRGSIVQHFVREVTPAVPAKATGA